MLRADNIICGTSTTGTGTLTLAACPSPPGGVDLYALANALSLGTSNTIPTPYTIIEYTDSNFTTAKSTEKGMGALTLGANISATTLARTTVQQTATGLNGTPTFNYASASAITIGTAANTLVFIGPSTAETFAHTPYYENTSGDNLGAGPMVIGTASTGTSFNCDFNSIGNLVDFYTLFSWHTPMTVKRISFRTGSSAGSGGTSNLYARLYDIASNGRPGKLLYDFGLVGPSNASLHTSNTNISSGASGGGFLLLPGDYFLGLIHSGTDSPRGNIVGIVNTSGGSFSGMVRPMRMGTTTLKPYGSATATSGNSAAPDTANVASYTPAIEASGVSCPMFVMAPS